MLINPISANVPKVETPPIVISLFGTFSVQVNGHPIASFRSSKARGLLAYLLLTRPQPLLRSVLLDLLWSGYGAESALTSLRQALANVRSSLKPFDLLHADRHHVHLAVDPTLVWCDALHFDALLDACQHHAHRSLAGCPACQERLRQALALYQGPFLHNLPAVDSAPFTAWLYAQQRSFAERVAAVQSMLAASATPRGNLSRPLTTLIGRTTELNELADKALDPVYRCLTLIGPGGIGKTRLACALGAQVQPHFPDGVWLVELSGVAPATPDEAPEQVQERLATAIGQALNVTFYGAQPPTTQVANYLTERTVLLILDSFEYLTTGAGWLPTLLTAAPGVQILITTRHRLPLQSQLVYPLEGLGVPPMEATERNAAHLLAQYASLQLFFDRAANAGQPQPLDQRTLSTVGQLCRFVEGSPWAIELAVAMLHRQRPDRMLAAIQENYRALATDLLDVPLRQRSAAAVFQTAWALLTADEAQTLARCALFWGGFTLAAAQAVAAATPATLEALVQKSLLRQVNDERYAMHDLVRQFAGEQLALDAAATHATHAAHAAYFSELLATWQPDDTIEQRFRRAVTQDWENVQVAWRWAVANGQVALLQQGVRGLAEFYEIAGPYQEMRQTFDAALARVRLLLAANHGSAPEAAIDVTAGQRLLAHLLWRQAHLLTPAFGQLREATALATELVALAQQLGDQSLLAWGYYELGVTAHFQGDYERQQELFHLALPLAQQQGDLYQQAYCQQLIGAKHRLHNQYAAAQHAYEEALRLVETVGARRLALMISNNLGSCHYEAGNFTQALAYFQQGVAQGQQMELPDQAALATLGLGMVVWGLGDYANGRHYLETSQQTYSELGNHYLAGQILQMLAQLYLELGEKSLAAAYCQRALTTPATQSYEIQRDLLLIQAHLQRDAGNWSAARTHYESAYALSQQSNLPVHLLPVQTYLAGLHLAQGAVAAAHAAVEPLLAHFADTPFLASQRPQELLLIAYQILLANADPRATDVLHQAWALVQSQAEQISDPELRTTFLTNVPVNRALAGLIAA